MLNPEQSRPVSLANMARRLGVPSEWLREQANRGRIPHLRAGDRYLFDPDVVESIITAWARGEQPLAEATSGEGCVRKYRGQRRTGVRSICGRDYR
jgi:hypothetical protein